MACETGYDGQCETAFMDCTSLSISYNIMGQATISYVMVHKEQKLCYKNPANFVAGDKVFCGYILDLATQAIAETEWYETNVTMIATTTT